jgi:O-acetyl-ADP-ribose deacetylase (regulator of RNase III)
MAHKALVLPIRPVRPTVAFRVTAARASDVVLADGAAVESVTVPAAPAGSGGVDPRGRRRRRRRRSSTGTPTAALGASR